MQADADTELEAAVARERRRVRDEFAEALEEARADQAEALQRAAETDAQLLGLWQQLLPEGQRVYLHDRGILELDLVTVQPLLQRQGWAIAFSKSEGSARLVKVKVSATAWQAATRFWLVPTPPEAEPPRDPKTGLLLKDLVRV